MFAHPLSSAACGLGKAREAIKGLGNRVKDGHLRVVGESTVSGIRPGASWALPCTGTASSHLSVLVQKEGEISVH